MFATGTSFWGTQTGGWMSQDAYPRELAGAVGSTLAEIVGFASNGVYVSVADGMGGFLPPMLAMGSSFWGAQTGGWTSQDLYTRPRRLSGFSRPSSRGLHFGVSKRATGAARTPTRASWRTLTATANPISWALPRAASTCPSTRQP
jgi:hypothetical protein